MPRLKELVMDITNKCPMSCLHCSANSSPALNRFISYEKAVEIISDARGLGVEILSLTGGEPLLHPRLPDMISYAYQIGCTDIRLFTSGFGVCDWGALKSAGLKKVFFNLQAANAELHDHIASTKGSFNMVMKQVVEAKRVGLYVGFHFVPMKPNWRELPEVVKLAKKLNVDEVGVLRFVPQGRGLTNIHILQLDSDEFSSFLRMVSELLKNNGRAWIRMGCPFNALAGLITEWRKKKCPAADEMCHVLIDGSVAPCSAFKYQSNLKAGNVYKKRLKDMYLNGFSNFLAIRHSLGAEYDCTAQKMSLLSVKEV